MTSGGALDEGDRRASKALWLGAGALALVTLGLALTANPVLALLPSIAVVAVYALLKLPLRVPALLALFVTLIVDNPADNGKWRSPVFFLGELLLLQLKVVTHIGALVLTGIDYVLLTLVALYVYRRVRGVPTDDHPVVKAPPALIGACLTAIGMILLCGLYGAVRGGEFRWAQWQLLQMLHMPVVVLIFCVLLPGPSVGKAVGRVYVAAAVIKSLVCLYVAREFPDAAFMTSHQDSILFAVATCHLVLHFLERPTTKTALVNLVLQPLLLMAMVKNDRRLVWVQVAFAIAIIFVATDWSRIKFRLLRTAISAMPFALLYVAIGWNTEGTGIFKPVATLRSMADSDSDASTKWRDLENFNLHATLATGPVLGIGLGHPFLEVVQLPDVTRAYELEPYAPHNSMFGLWAFTGYVGFSAFWMVLTLSAFYAYRAYRAARAPPERITALTTVSALVVYMVHAYGDIGLGVWHGLLIVGSATAVSAKLAVATGACTEPRFARAAARRTEEVQEAHPAG